MNTVSDVSTASEAFFVPLARIASPAQIWYDNRAADTFPSADGQEVMIGYAAAI